MRKPSEVERHDTNGGPCDKYKPHYPVRPPTLLGFSVDIALGIGMLWLLYWAFR